MKTNASPYRRGTCYGFHQGSLSCPVNNEETSSPSPLQRDLPRAWRSPWYTSMFSTSSTSFAVCTMLHHRHKRRRAAQVAQPPPFEDIFETIGIHFRGVIAR
jgi:hypothetical protein